MNFGSGKEGGRDVFPEVGSDEVGGAHGVDDAEAGGVAAGKGEVALADAFVEVEGFAFDAVVFGRATVLAFGGRG